MRFMGKNGRWLAPVGILILALAAYSPLKALSLAIGLALALEDLAQGESDPDGQVIEEQIRGRMDDEELTGIAYRPPSSRPHRAMVLAAGISELGCYHPRLVALSRALARRGFFVLTPDIEMFRRFHISPRAIDEISFWFRQLSRLEGAEDVHHAGLAGISFSGTLALIAAARPENSDDVDFVLTIGAYEDLIRCCRGWFGPGPEPIYGKQYPTRFYAKWIIMLAARDLMPEGDRPFLETVLMSLLRETDSPEAPPDLTPEGRRWYRLALEQQPDRDPVLVGRIIQHLTPLLHHELSPGRALAELRCPVFFAHGAYDDLIPPEESLKLREKTLRAESQLLVSPFLTHTHPPENPLGASERLTAAARLLAFLYDFFRATG